MIGKKLVTRFLVYSFDLQEECKNKKKLQENDMHLLLLNNPQAVSQMLALLNNNPQMLSLLQSFLNQ